MSTETTRQPAAAEPIPTDPYGLAEHLRKLPPGASVDVADRLAVQLGATPEAIERACDLVDAALAERRRQDLIVCTRAGLAQHLADALHAVHAADGSLAALRADDLYDVEYVEGGQPVRDLKACLDDAARMLRAAAAFNPCPPDKANGGA